MRPSNTDRPGRRRRVLVACFAVACLALAAASSAGAELNKGKVNKADFLRFINCPVTEGKVCTYGETLEGEFKMGTAGKSVPITNPTVLQGGLEAEGFGVYPLIPPRFGALSLSKTPQPVPGGLTGLSEEVGGPVYATAELAGTPFVRPTSLGFGEHKAIELPIKVHLENEQLGPNCYIGSDTEPVNIALWDGPTEPPEGVEPIEGKIGTVKALDKNKITEFEGNELVGNTFEAPAAKNCGTNALTEPVITALVDTAEGLPSPPGKNVARLKGNLFTAFSPDVIKYNKKALKEKEHPKKTK